MPPKMAVFVPGHSITRVNFIKNKNEKDFAQFRVLKSRKGILIQTGDQKDILKPYAF
jgi:hypothetical protein